MATLSDVRCHALSRPVADHDGFCGVWPFLHTFRVEQALLPGDAGAPDLFEAKLRYLKDNLGNGDVLAVPKWQLEAW